MKDVTTGGDSVPVKFAIEGTMRIYNYPSFPQNMDNEDFGRFPEVARVGGKAPDGELLDARDQSRVRLSELWSDGVTVLEFGSIT
jgi:hypothetical protein